MFIMLVLIANPLYGFWMSKERCRTVVAISCRVVAVTGGAAAGAAIGKRR